MVWKSLPLPVVDNILARLDQRDLATLCRTSTVFSSTAKRFLYAGKWTLSKSAKLDQCLRINLDNAQFLRFYRSTSFELLQEIVTRPIQLDLLEINYGPDQLPDASAILKLIKSMHPQTQIKAVNFTNTKLLGKNGRALYCSLEHFHGLKSLKVLCRRNMEDTIFISNLCKDLRDLYLDECHHWQVDLSFLGLVHDRNNLRSIHFHFSSMSSLPGSIDDKGLRNLRHLEDFSVFLRITANSRHDQMISFYQVPFAALKGKGEIKRFVEWLIRGDIYFATQVDKTNHSVHDLRELEATERNKVLEIIQKMSLDHNLGFRLSIFPSDSRDFYEPDSPRKVAALSKFLPERTSYLNLFVKGSVHTKYIPAIIRSLRNLKHLVVSVYARNPFPEDGGDPEDEYDSDQDPIYCLEPGAWCTRVAYSIRTDDKLEGQKSWSLELRKGGTPRWIEVDYHNGGITSPLQETYNEEIVMKNEAFVKELNEWFKVNGSLKAIDFRVFGGSTWSFKYMSS
jgi:hypothetical protein